MACTKVAKSMNSNLCLLKRLSLVALTLLLIPWPSAAQTQVEQDYVNIEDFIRSNDNNKTSDDGGDGVEYVDLLSDFQLQEGVMNEDDHSHDHSSSNDFEAHTQSIEEILNPDDDTTTTPSPPSPEKEEDPSGNVVHDSWDDIYGDSSQDDTRPPPPPPPPPRSTLPPRPPPPPTTTQIAFDSGESLEGASDTVIQEKAFTPLIKDESELPKGSDQGGPELYKAGQLPRPRFVMLGQQGVGKSSMANTLLGFDNLASLTNKKVRKKLPFKIGHGLKSKTRMTSFSTGRWLGVGPNVTVTDTPGFKDTDDAEFVDEIMNVLGDEIKEVDSFLIVYKYKDRFTRPFKRTLSMLTKMFGNFWTNVVLVVNFWSFKELYVEDRQNRGVTMESYGGQLKKIFQDKFDLDFELPVVFLDTHYNKSNPAEDYAFKRESDKLWKVSLERRPFECQTRKDVQERLNQEKQDLASMRRDCRSTKKENKDMEVQLATKEKQIAAQMFVMNNLRNGIDYLKEHCHKDQTNDVILGCEWSDWTEWSQCTKTCGGGQIKRVREKLPGLGTCDGSADELANCENEVCPLENDQNSLVVVIGGETEVSRENEHSKSVEILGANGLCRLSGVPDLPEARGKLCAAYDPSGAIIVCGGGERFWRPNANCWQMLAGMTGEWQEIPQMYPVHGAAVAFFKGKFWVFGGSTGDDNYDHTITDKVQAYNPIDRDWSVESPLTSARHKACAVAMEDAIVITGGTSLGLGKVKPQWLAEIGTRTAESLDADTGKWGSLPSLSRAKVEHGCSVVSIGGSRGVLVVGGATGDDLVEFLDWEVKKEWRVLGRLNNGRGMMPGIGFIGGKLSVIGGYSWPGGVELVEQFDEDNEEWVKTDIKIKYKRYNHATLTVPGDMFPQCVGEPSEEQKAEAQREAEEEERKESAPLFRK